APRNHPRGSGPRLGRSAQPIKFKAIRYKNSRPGESVPTPPTADVPADTGAFSLNVPSDPPTLNHGNSAATQPPSALPAIPGYELLALLPPGGQGVVYKARQVKLDRIVALKMIRGVEIVTEKDLERFNTETRATAHLAHPNIVTIHDSGTHNKLPF